MTTECARTHEPEEGTMTPTSTPTYGHAERVATLEAVLALREQEARDAFARRWATPTALTIAEANLAGAIVDVARAHLAEARDAAPAAVPVPVALTYATNPTTGTVHLYSEPHRSTLCHRPLAGMTYGDETMSGLAVTCGTCERVAVDFWEPADYPKAPGVSTVSERRQAAATLATACPVHGVQACGTALDPDPECDGRLDTGD